MSSTAGWYPDPTSTEHLRYWDGANWTDDVSRIEDWGEPQAAPAVEAAPPVDTSPALAAVPTMPAAVSLPPPPEPPVYEPPPSPFAPPAHLVAPPVQAVQPVPVAADPVAGLPPPPVGYETQRVYEPSWSPPAGQASPGTQNPAWGGAPVAPVAPVAPAPPPPQTVAPMAAYRTYGAEPRTIRSISARRAWAAALMGLQSGPPLLYGLFFVMGAAAFSRFSNDIAVPSEASGRLALIGVLGLLLGFGLFFGAVGVGLLRGWGRLLAYITEGLGVILAVIVLVATGEFLVALIIAGVPAIVIFLVVTDED